MQTDDERQVRRLRARRLLGQRPSPAEPGRHQDRVAEARDREQLGEALDDADDDRLEVGQLIHGQATPRRGSEDGRQLSCHGGNGRSRVHDIYLTEPAGAPEAVAEPWSGACQSGGVRSPPHPGHMTTAPSVSARRIMLNKVPEVTVYFWIIKILCTTVGESFADYINETLGFGLTNTTLLFSAALIVALVAQFRLQPLRARRLLARRSC